MHPIRTRLLLAFAAVALAVQVATAANYGYFRDELYYIACSEHLAWGYVDHPPLSILVLWLSRHVLGDSLHALRLFPALAGAATVFLTGWACGKMEGGRFAQALAMLSVLVAPFYLFVDHVYSMNAFDVLFWTAASALLVRLFDGADAKLWIVLGLVLGLGLLNKISVLWLGFALVIALRLGPHRGWYMTRWPWLSGGLAFALFSPHVAWQVTHGWPTLVFIRNAARFKIESVTPLKFLAEQLFLMNPVTLPVSAAGLGWLLAGSSGRKFRPLGLIFLVGLALFLPGGKPAYLGPAYPLLFAAGGVAIERLVARRTWSLARPAALALVAAGGIVLAPMGLPVLPVETYVRYAGLLGIAPRTEERHRLGVLPQHYADMFGWESIVQTVAQVYRDLPPEDRARAGIFAQNYGEAGAIDFLGPRYGLPRAMSGHNNYWYWGPLPNAGDVLVVLGGERKDNEEVCGELEQVATTDCGYCMPYENGVPVYVCRSLRTPIAALWPRLKRFI